MTVATLLAIHAVSPVVAGEAEPDRIARGRYVFAVAGGCGCHTAADGQVNAGGRPLETPYGTYYGTNITPDKTYGIGSWTTDEIIESLRSGIRPDGSVLSPVMPYPAFSGMSDEDVHALVAYLLSVPPVARENRPPEVFVPLGDLVARMWRWAFFRPGKPAGKAPGAGAARGRYLSEHVAHCQECHTPRTVFGTLDRALYLAGTSDIGGEVAPNITPDLTSGIGDWSTGDIVTLLHSGFLPNFDNVQGLMALVIDGVAAGGYRDLTIEDARAIASYLKSVPPVAHQVD